MTTYDDVLKAWARVGRALQLYSLARQHGSDIQKQDTSANLDAAHDSFKSRLENYRNGR